MKRLHFTKCRTSLLAVLLAFSVAFVPVPPISDTSSDSAALITTAQAAQKNTKDRFSIKEVLHFVKCNRFMGFPPYSVMICFL